MYLDCSLTLKFIRTGVDTMAGVENKIIDADEAGMRLDRWFKLHFPGLGFGQLQKLLRSGQIRIDGGRVKSDTRVATGQTVRLPPQVTGDDAKSNIAKPLTRNTIRDRNDLCHVFIYVESISS